MSPKMSEQLAVLSLNTMFLSPVLLLPSQQLVVPYRQSPEMALCGMYTPSSATQTLQFPLLALTVKSDIWSLVAVGRVVGPPPEQLVVVVLVGSTRALPS
jgi:hypothetical protein